MDWIERNFFNPQNGGLHVDCVNFASNPIWIWIVTFAVLNLYVECKYGCGLHLFLCLCLVG